MTNIYILKLEKGHFYVGKTTDVEKRYQEHLRGSARWTKKFKPVGIDKVIKNASPFDEDKYVKEYMLKYGINMVRGGSYSNERLDDIQYESLKTEIWGATDCCIKCGRNSHFAKDCYAKTDVDGFEIFQTEIIKCSRCKKYGHYASTCWSRN